MSQPPRAARDVPAGASWAFRDHRTLAQVIADENTRTMTHPERITCAECRFYSDRVARAHVGTAAYVEALCLNRQSPYRDQYLRENSWCRFAERGTPVDAYGNRDGISK